MKFPLTYSFYLINTYLFKLIKIEIRKNINLYYIIYKYIYIYLTSKCLCQKN
jgi:hypothetical protein